MSRIATLAILLTLAALPALAAPCNLEISLTCTSGHCTSTTRNAGSTACTGTYMSAFFSEQPGVAISGFGTSLGLEVCFDNNTFPVEDSGAFAFCFGDATLGPGQTFTATGTLSTTSPTPNVSVIGITYVFDSETEEEQAFVYAYNDANIPTCTPIANVPPVTLTGVPYTVSWTETLNPQTQYIVEESTTADFSTIAATRTVQGTSTQFTHAVTTSTRYYYRVRAAQCQGAVGPNSAPVSIVVQAVPPATTRGTDAVVPFGTTNPVDIPLAVNLGALGKTALDGTTFTTKTDKPYLTVTPASGTIPSNGTVDLKVTASPGALPPGANTGTVTVTTNTGSTINVPVSVSLVTPVSPTGKTVPPGNAVIIPVVTHVVGFTGPFQSDVRLTNASLGQIKYQVTYTPSNTDGTTSSKATIVPVDAGTTIALNDVVRDFFGIGAAGDAGAGSLEIRPLNNSSTLTYASSRTFVTTTKGTLGQFIAAIPFPLFASNITSVLPVPGQPPPSGQPTLSFQQVSESTAFRTNFGVVEGSGTPASFRLRVYDDNGTMLKEKAYSLRPGEHRQFNQFIANEMGLPSLLDGRIELVMDSDTGAVSGYASVLDNITTDPMAVMPAQPALIQASRFVLPGMADLASPFSNFHSDVRLFNGGAAAVSVTPTFYPQNGGAPMTGAAFTLNRNEVKRVDNALPVLFGAASTGGSIVFATNAPASLVATGRTFSNSDDGGTYGQFIPGVSPLEGIGNGDRPLQILQLEQSQNFRTNLGIAELSGNAATVRVSLVLPDSKISPSTEVQLGPNQFTQLGRVIEAMVGAGQNVYNARILVQVTGGTGRVTAYGSVIDNFTADPTYVPAQ